MRTRIVSLLLLNVLATSAFAGQERGGGDTLSHSDVEYMKHIKAYLRNPTESKNIEFLENFQQVRPQGPMSDQIRDLIERGIIEDMKNAKYEFKQRCVDEDNIGRSASTLRVDLSYQKNPVRPSICVNLRKLALERAYNEDIDALLFHEHARHFGLEDTDEYGLHPLAMFVRDNWRRLEFVKEATLKTNGYFVSQKHNAKKVNTLFFQDLNDPKYASNRFTSVITKDENLGGFSLVIDRLSGECSDVQVLVDKDRTELQFLTYFPHEIDSRDGKYPPIHTIGEVQEGLEFRVPSAMSIDVRPTFYLVSPAITKGRKTTILGHDRVKEHNKQQCTVRYHFEFAGVKGPQEQTYLEATNYRPRRILFPIGRVIRYNEVKEEYGYTIDVNKTENNFFSGFDDLVKKKTLKYYY